MIGQIKTHVDVMSVLYLHVKCRTLTGLEIDILNPFWSNETLGIDEHVSEDNIATNMRRTI